jgi:vacuolar-type H+-ATPase subunit I/STV1
MTRSSHLGCGLLLGALLWSAVVPAAFAQQTRTLTIQEGTVHVDGRQLAPDQVPGDLNLDGVTARYRFVGIQRPVIELGGRLYAVDDGLTPVSEEEVNAEKSSVILQEIEARPAAVRSSGQGQSTASRSLQQTRAAHQQYLSDVQKANRELYERLLRERTMESQAQNLARVVRMLPENSEERRVKADSLRALLNDIFDLKQENRLREIERLQREIQNLQRSLQKRKQMREAMIDHRLNQLLTSSGD